MDLRGWKWKSPWEKRNYVFSILFYLILLLPEHYTVADGGLRQELKNEIQDSTKLDSLRNYLPYDSKEDSDYKRASAFFPLRGKKFPSDDTTDHQFIIPDEEDDKRSQFFPLRGKKVPDDLKRASYFTPMRGRKDDGWIVDYDITDENPFKRASSFMPMRGKKKFEAISDYLNRAGTYSSDIDELLNSPNSNNYQADDKRLSFVPVRGRRSLKEPSDSPQKNDSNHSTGKRAVSFMPMRGRKDFDDSEDDTPGSVVTTLLEKKKHSFMPMRGRRENEFDDENQDLDKKAMFMPMRGKKEDDDPFSIDIQNESTLKRAHYFMPMRGRRTYLRDVVNGIPNVPDSESSVIDDKRASSFMPMRGRRLYLENSLDPESSHDKRKSSFTLMRGRRLSLENNLDPESSHDKRKSSFTLMRGKKSTEDFKEEKSDHSQDSDPDHSPVRVRRSVDEDLKVDPWPADQLMPLLDKKSSSFMPMRGRRFMERNITVDPWQADQLMSLFNKKSFMPMRGRRFEDSNFTIDPWQADQLMSLFNKKSSFMPMRGRRFDGTNFTVDPWPTEQFMSLFNKKSSSFMPMRGRRDNEDYAQLNSEETDYGEKRSSYFMPMRGRREESKAQSFFRPYPYFMSGIGSSLMYKPYSDLGVSFNTVGGDRERQKNLKINWDAVKRAFHASRGKRLDAGMTDLMDAWYNHGTIEQDDDSPSKSNEKTEDEEDKIYQERCSMWTRLAEQLNKQYTDKSSELTDSIHIINSLIDEYYWCKQNNPDKKINENKDEKTRVKRGIIRPSLAMQPNRQYIALKRPMSFFATRGKRMEDSTIDKISKLH